MGHRLHPASTVSTIVLACASLLVLPRVPGHEHHTGHAAGAGHAQHPRAADRYSQDHVIRGVSWEAGRRPVNDEDFHPLVAAGVEWIALVPYGFQRGTAEPGFAMPWSGRAFWGESDQGLRNTTEAAKRHGLRVMLKPQLWVHGRDSWVGDIAMHNEEDWSQWFENYSKFIVHYAELAEDAGIDLLSVGTELEGTVAREQQWRQIITAVRQAYTGPLTYSANWNRTYLRVGFWDALDYVGVNAYFPLHPGGDVATGGDLQIGTISSAALRQAWNQHLTDLKELQQRVGKPLIFTEAGYRSLSGSLAAPWQWRSKGNVDLQVQAAAYDALLATFWRQPWFGGLFFWKWGAHRSGGPHDHGYTPRNKPAEEVMARWYERPAGPGSR
ncbi:MAG: hypothetical protein ACE5HV_17460 [Acidobacteriota bacterium]